MQIGKSDIKSKKDKLAEKKQQKKKLTVKPIEISSSEEELHQPIPIQTRRSPPKVTPTETNKRYNVFNIDRLKKIEIDHSRFDPKQLIVEENTRQNPMNHTEARALFSYRIEGNESTKYVSDLYLQQRVKKIMEEQEVRTNAENREKEKEQLKVVEVDGENLEEKEKEEKQKQQQQQEEKKPTRACRYFQSLIKEGEEEERDLVKCFRCGKRGHIAKNCIEQRQQQKCLYCLGDHHHHDCNSRTCFKCNELGHIAQQCRSVGMECRKCRKKGHAEKHCGTIVFLDYSRIKSDQQFRDRFTGDDLKRVRCLAGCKDPNGHFNCHQYQSVNSKNAPYATYHQTHQSSQRDNEDYPSFKNMKKYQYTDLDPKYSRKHESNDRNHDRSYDRSYDRWKHDRFQSYQHAKPQRNSYFNNKGKQKSQKSNYDNYNQQYNVRYDHNVNQRINQRYEYGDRRW